MLQYPKFLTVQDNVFVTVVASVQYRALAEKASDDAFYKLSNTGEQIQAYVFDGMDLVLNNFFCLIRGLFLILIF